MKFNVPYFLEILIQNRRLIEQFGNVVESALKRLQGSLELKNNLFSKEENTKAGKKLKL